MARSLNLFKLAAVLAALSSFVACVKVDVPTTSEPATPVLTPQPMSDADMAATAKAVANALNLTAAGGQPGKITLIGALAKDEKIDAKDRVLQIEQRAGYGWHGARAKVAADRVERIEKLSEGAEKELDTLALDNTYINFGCEAGEVPPKSTQGLQEVKWVADESSPIAVIKAHTVLLCHVPTIKQPTVIIVGHDVHMAMFDFGQTGTEAQSLSISASRMLINVGNKIGSYAPESGTTILAGPSITLTARTVLSELSTGARGSIHITTQGADYKQEEKK